MRERDATAALAGLGLSPQQAPMVALLPMLYVAWADGRITEREHAELLRISAERGLDLNELSQPPWPSWLVERPRFSVFANGRELLVRLAYQDPDQGIVLPKAAMARLESDCLRMARASGTAAAIGTISTCELRAIAELCQGVTRDLASLDLPPMRCAYNGTEAETQVA